MLGKEEHFAIEKGLKRIAWPPSFEDEINNTYLESENSDSLPEKQKYSSGPTPWRPVSSAPQQISNPRTQPSPPFQFTHPSTVYSSSLPDPPTFLTLREDPPFNQEISPVFPSQPAAIKGLTQNMRGDEKWPPANYKAQAVAENEARKALAKGPAFRPKKVKKDYSSFFAQNALNPNYPGYRAPPGTQHYIEEGISNF